MKRFLTSAFLCLAAFIFLAQPVAAANYPLLLVVNRDDENVMFINAKTFEILGTIDLLRSPMEIVATPDGKTAFVSHVRDHRNQISVIDVAKMEETGQIRLKQYVLPNGMAVSRDGSRLFATYEGSRAAVELDIATGKVLGAFETRKMLSHMLALTPDEKYLYVANAGDNNVSIFDLKTGKLIRHAYSGRGCEGLAARPDGTEVWALNKSQDTIAIFSTSDNRVAETIECRGFPMRITFTPDGKHALVTCAEWNHLAVFDVATREIIKRIDTGISPVSVVLEPDGKTAYITEVAENTVSVINLETREKTRTVDVGTGPFGIVYIEAK